MNGKFIIPDDFSGDFSDVTVPNATVSNVTVPPIPPIRFTIPPLPTNLHLYKLSHLSHLYKLSHLSYQMNYQYKILIILMKMKIFQKQREN